MAAITAIVGPLARSLSPSFKRSSTCLGVMFFVAPSKASWYLAFSSPVATSSFFFIVANDTAFAVLWSRSEALSFITPACFGGLRLPSETRLSGVPDNIVFGARAALLTTGPSRRARRRSPGIASGWFSATFSTPSSVFLVSATGIICCSSRS